MLSSSSNAFIGKQPTSINTANHNNEQQVASPVSILVTPRASATHSPQETEFTRVNEDGVHYSIEPTSERLSPPDEQQQFNSPSIGGETNYQQLLNASIPLAYRRPNEGPSYSDSMVEVPDDVLSSPASATSRSPQHIRPCRNGVW